MISRTHPGLVRRLFEQEVPEIFDGTIEIKSVSREAGSRTKIAVFSKEEDVDPVGACIGPRGQRVSNIVDALGGEKIDIVKYNDDVPLTLLPLWRRLMWLGLRSWMRKPEAAVPPCRMIS